MQSSDDTLVAAYLNTQYEEQQPYKQRHQMADDTKSAPAENKAHRDAAQHQQYDRKHVPVCFLAAKIGVVPDSEYICNMLLPYLHKDLIEAGCDEAGRGCLAGPVYAAAVILPPDFRNEELNDSKQLCERRRYALREVIEREALAWAVGTASAEEIDSMNILNASIMAMHRAVTALKVRPQHLLIDGNRFRPYPGIAHTTVVKGDGKYLSIAAASILAKTYRDDCMMKLHAIYPVYGWDRNKGYPTKAHRDAIAAHGTTPCHRQTFNLTGNDGQLELDFG